MTMCDISNTVFGLLVQKKRGHGDRKGRGERIEMGEKKEGKNITRKQDSV